MSGNRRFGHDVRVPAPTDPVRGASHVQVLEELAKVNSEELAKSQFAVQGSCFQKSIPFNKRSALDPTFFEVVPSLFVALAIRVQGKGCSM